MFYIGELAAFFVVHNRIKVALATMLRFHDYLTSYRLTPRSRILRKHLPKLTMVIEEESQMDQSMISQVERSRIYSTSAVSQAVSHVTGVAASALSRKKKFVYVDVDE